MPVNDGGLYGVLALVIAVHPRGIKVGEAALDERIHHLLGQSQSSMLAVVVLVEQGRRIMPKAKFFYSYHSPIP